MVDIFFDDKFIVFFCFNIIYNISFIVDKVRLFSIGWSLDYIDIILWI